MISKLIVKVSGACNLACSYCYYMKDRPKSAQRNMTSEVMRRTLENFATSLSEEGGQECTIYWHGGEPFLQPMSFWKNVSEVQHVISSESGLVWKNYVTTNGTTLTPEICLYLKTESWNVAVSIDGPPDQHDRERVYHSGRGSSSDVLSGVRALADHGIAATLLTVLDEESTNADELFDFFSRIEARSVDLLLPLYNWVDQREVLSRNRKLLEIISRFFSRWCKAGRPFGVRFFDSLFNKLADGTPGMCHHEHVCHEVITVEPDGRVNLCDDLIAVDGQPTDLIQIEGQGNSSYELAYHDLSARVFSVVKARGYYNLGDECRSCELLDICQGGCPATRWNGNDYKSVSVHCEIYKTFYGQIRFLFKEAVAG